MVSLNTINLIVLENIPVGRGGGPFGVCVCVCVCSGASRLTFFDVSGQNPAKNAGFIMFSALESRSGCTISNVFALAMLSDARPPCQRCLDMTSACVFELQNRRIQGSLVFVKKSSVLVEASCNPSLPASLCTERDAFW